MYLHVGAPKTGTTYLQDVLWNNRAVLRRIGVLYPGLSPDAHFHGAMDLQGSHFQEHANPTVPGAWQRLVGQARDWSGTVLLSHEMFSAADDQTAERALRDLSWAEVHIVHTARDLARQIPAVWQEDVKNRQVLSFTEYARELSTPDARCHYLTQLFWRLQDVPRVLRAWSAGLPPERVHLVTVPPRGAPPGELWARFSRAIGIDEHHCDTSLVRDTNRSMGVAETNLLRRLNVALDDSLDWPTYDWLVKYQLGGSVLGGRQTSTPLTLPADDHGWVSARAEGMVGALRDAGYHVVGSLDDLFPGPPAQAGRHPDDANDAELVDTAIHALVGLLRAADGQPRRSRPAWRQTLVRLSQRHPAVGQLRQHYLTTKARRYR